VLSVRCFCDGLITRPEESYRLWRVVVCDQETSKTRRLKTATGLWKIQPQWVVTPGKQTINIWEVQQTKLVYGYHNKARSRVLAATCPAVLYSAHTGLPPMYLSVCQCNYSVTSCNWPRKLQIAFLLHISLYKVIRRQFRDYFSKTRQSPNYVL
jgi:hypothetical protein